MEAFRKIILVSLLGCLCHSVDAHSESVDPVTFLAKVYSENPKPNLEKCSLLFVPIVSEQGRIKEDLSRTDLYEFGILTAESGFKNSALLETPLNGFESDYLNALSARDFTRLRGKAQNNGVGWILSAHPSREVRETALYYNSVAMHFKLWDEAALRKYLTEVAPSEISSEVRVDRLFRGVKSQAEDIEKNSLQLNALAASYDLLHARATAKGLGSILEWMKPQKVLLGSSQNAFSLEEIYRKVLSDPIYSKASVKAALKVLDRIKSSSADGDFFSDILESFVEVGVPRKEAYERTWDLVALYSTRGASIGETLLDIADDVNPLTISLNTISIGMNIIDATRFKSGRNYSYPQNLRVSFDTGKPYHFWMSAYFARRLASAGTNQVSAGLAAYLAELGYQMKSRTFGRVPEAAFTRDAFSPANNKIRLDLVYGTAGARFGAEASAQLPSKPMDLDLAFRKMLAGSEPLEPLHSAAALEIWSGTGIKAYFRWKKIFNPDALLDALHF